MRHPGQAMRVLVEVSWPAGQAQGTPLSAKSNKGKGRYYTAGFAG
ncbi:hypothetical protein [Mycobacterium leprae]|nr:hypothetical protein [Mycobacterium leprae]